MGIVKQLKTNEMNTKVNIQASIAIAIIISAFITGVILIVINANVVNL